MEKRACVSVLISDDKKRIRISIFMLLIFILFSLLIVFIKQEYIIIPDFIKTSKSDVKESILESFYNERWRAFIISPLILVLRVFAISFCLYLGGFFSRKFFNLRYSNCLVVSIWAQGFQTIYSISICIAQLIKGTTNFLDPKIEFSLLTLFKDLITDTSQIWVVLPLLLVNIIEIFFVLFLSFCLSKRTNVNFGYSLIYVFCTYGVGCIFFIVIASLFLLFNVQ